MNRRFTAGLAAAALASVALAAPASAAPKAEEAQRAAVLQGVLDCRKMTDRDARLACYDSAADKLDQAEATGQVVVVDKQQVQTMRKEVFGLQLPSLDLFNRSPRSASAEPLDRITATVKTASRGPDGRWVLELDTGAVWRQIDDTSIPDPRPGEKAMVRRAALGSFFVKVEGGPAVRAHRER